MYHCSTSLEITINLRPIFFCHGHTLLSEPLVAELCRRSVVLKLLGDINFKNLKLWAVFV